MKIDFSDVYDISTSYAREAVLLGNAIYECNSKTELLQRKCKIEIAAIECRDRILSEMLEEQKRRLEDFNAENFTDE